MLANSPFCSFVAASLCSTFSVLAGITLQPNGTIYNSYLSVGAPVNREMAEIRFFGEFQDRFVFIQAESTADNHTIVTADPFDRLTVWFYANSFLGYINPATGTMLHLEKVQAYGQTQPIVNGYPRFQTYQIPEEWVYPGTSQKIRDSNFVFYNEDGSILKAFSGRYIYKTSGRELNFRASGYDDREDYFFWHNGAYINHPVTKSRSYSTGGGYMIDPTVDPRETPFSRPAWYEDGTQFFNTQPIYPGGQNITGSSGDAIYLYYPAPNNTVKLADIRPGGFIQIRYPNNDVAKQDIAPHTAQLRRTDGTLVSQIAHSFEFASGVSVSIAADEKGEFIGIYRDQPHSVAAVVHARKAPANIRNARVVEVTDTTIRIEMDRAMGVLGNYMLHVHKGKDESSPFHQGQRISVRGTTATITNLEPDTPYIIHLEESVLGGGSNEPYYIPVSTLHNVSTGTRLALASRATDKVITTTSNSPGERYRIEESKDLRNWNIAAPTKTSPSTPAPTLEWIMGNQPGHQFFKVKKLSPFEYE